MRLHTAFDGARQLPTRLCLHLPDTNDHEALKHWDLPPWQGWTVLVDLGYYGHRQLERLQVAGVSFLSRLHPQGAYQVTACRAPCHQRRDVVFSNEPITLGSPTNRQGRCGRASACIAAAPPPGSSRPSSPIGST